MNKNTQEKMNTSYRLCCYILCFCMVFLFTSVCAFTQENGETIQDKNAEIEESKNDTEFTRIRQTLRFGTDNAVIESLKTLSAMGLTSFVPDVMKRMRSSKNEKVLVSAFTYLREVKSIEAVELALSLVKDFRDYPLKALQFAFFYIQDMVDSLSDEMKNMLNKTIMHILEKDNPRLSLTALSIVPYYYSEADEAYYGDSFFEDAYLSSENTNTSIKNMPIDSDDPKNRLLSWQLIKNYELLFTKAVQDEVIITLGKIKAYNALPFILRIVEDERRITQSQRRSVILALGAFDLTDDTFVNVRKRRLEVFENARKDPSAQIRETLFQALYTHDSSEVEQPMMEYYSFIPQWLIDGIRDDTIEVRKAVLTRIKALFDFFSEEEKALFFDAVSFIVENDTSDVVREKAVDTFSKFSEGRTFILNAVKNINTLNVVNSKYIEVALTAYADNGGVEALQAMVEKIIDESKQRQGFFSDSLALMQKVSSILASENNAQISDIAALMLQHPDTTIQKNTLTIIAKNKFAQFLDTVQQMSEDVAVPSTIRTQAKQTIEVLKSE